jgi:hypothetical protein
MAIGKIKGPMLYDNLERQGVNLSFDGNLLYLDVNSRRIGVGTESPQYSLDVPANVRLANLIVLGNTITSNTGKIGLGSISSLVVTGGDAYNIILTDGAGNLRFGTLDEISGNTTFTGNTIELGVNTVGNLSNAIALSTTITVTDSIALLNQLLGNITDSTGTDLHISGNLTAGGNIFANNVSTTLTIGNSGQFFGNTITGYGALYAGIPTGFTILPYTPLQITTNSNAYSQLNQQNLNNGSLASSDYVITADNGTDTSFYGDFGIASSTYSYPGFSAIGPNDVYLLGVGYSAEGPFTGNVGNVIISSSNGYVKLLAGGAEQGNVVMTLASPDTVTSSTTEGAVTITGGAAISGVTQIGGNVVAASGTASNSVTTGALVVVGGVGISGNINAGNIEIATVHAGQTVTTDLFVVSTSTIDHITANTASIGNLAFADTTVTHSNVFVFSSNSAIQVPVGDTSQRPAGVNGYLRYNTDTPALEYFDGSIWVPVTNTVTDQILTGDGVNDTFTLTQSATTVGVIVSINGTLQQPYTAYNITANQLSFTETPQDTDIIDVRFLGAAVTLNSTLSDDLTVSGNITVGGNVTLSGILSAPQTTKAANDPGQVGEICWDAFYIYVCTAPNTWKRSALIGGY